MLQLRLLFVPVLLVNVLRAETINIVPANVTAFIEATAGTAFEQQEPPSLGPDNGGRESTATAPSLPATAGYINNQSDSISVNLSNNNINNSSNNNLIDKKLELINSHQSDSKIPMKYVNKVFNIKKIEKTSALISPPLSELSDWKCPNITHNRNLECSCDMPHILRCSGDVHGLELIADGLRESDFVVSLLDCTLKNVTVLSDARIFENVSLHGLVISSGEIKRVHRLAFAGMRTGLQALGLPNNALTTIPVNALQPLTSLDRLDLSNNKIKSLSSSDFVPLQQLTYLELSENQISSISIRTFTPLKKLITLKLNGNRLGDFSSSLQTIGQCINLRELNLRSNSIKGPLTQKTLPSIAGLESLNLDKNLFTRIENGALKGFPYLVTLSLRHNQIDVLQDHAFSELSYLQVLDLGHNGIVSVSGASLKHLPRLLVLDLTHNFLRALSADIITPLPALKELRLDGNDISIVARNALVNASHLHNLSLQDNPLACDCMLKPFVEWLSTSKIPSQDLLGAICATPPHLEGAPLLQIPVDSLSCESSRNDMESTGNAIKQIETLIEKNSNDSLVKDFSESLKLQESHFSKDYGLILMWNIDMTKKKNEFTCDIIFVFKEFQMKENQEVLVNNSAITCESTVIESQNIVSTIIPDNFQLQFGEKYRFCLALKEDKEVENKTILIGCSNIIRLTQNTSNNEEENGSTDDDIKSETESDISDFEKITGRESAPSIETEYHTHLENAKASDSLVSSGKSGEEHGSSKSTRMTPQSAETYDQETMRMLDNLNRGKEILPFLGFGILFFSVITSIWVIAKLRRNLTSVPSVTTCYTHDNTSSSQDSETRNRYFKLQATTSL